MTEEEQKQQLSFAYVHAIAARTGYACDRPTVDDDSVDLVIGARGLIHRHAVMRSPRLELQVKATAQDCVKEDHVVFPLAVKNYNDLKETTMIPRLLVVLVLPPDPLQWLEHTEEGLLTRRCAYWLSLRAMPDTDNKATITIRPPRQNLFNVEGLRSLMDRASRKEPL
jgi:uncharacterized protein DUF4365